MTNDETIKWLESLKAEIGKAEHRTLWHYAEAIDMAIEALLADTVSREMYDDVVQTIIKREKQFTNMVSVVRCKDCRHHGMRDCPVWGDDTTEDYMWCYYGERREK